MIERNSQYMRLRWDEYITWWDSGALEMLLAEMHGGDSLWVPDAELWRVEAWFAAQGRALAKVRDRQSGETQVTKKGLLVTPREAFQPPVEWGPMETWPAVVAAREKAEWRARIRTCSCGAMCETERQAKRHCPGIRGRPALPSYCARCGVRCESKKAAMTCCRKKDLE